MTVGIGGFAYGTLVPLGVIAPLIVQVGCGERGVRDRRSL